MTDLLCAPDPIAKLQSVTEKSVSEATGLPNYWPTHE